MSLFTCAEPWGSRGKARRFDARRSWLRAAVLALLAGAGTSACSGQDTLEATETTREQSERAAREKGCGEPHTPIAAVQGPADTSPLDGRVVTIEGVVTAAFGGRDELGGFFVQALREDDDERTSEGLFVYEGNAPKRRPAPGEHVRVRGRVSEVFGITQLVDVETSIACGRALVEPAALTWPADEVLLEAHEGMLVRFRAPLTLTSMERLQRYGELSLSSTRSFVTRAAWEGLEESPTLTLDDGSREEGLWPPRLVDEPLPRLGDALHELTGVLTQTSAGHALLATEGLRWDPRARPQAPRIAGKLRVAALNLGGYFMTLGTRGAASEPERLRQRDKLASTLTALDADIVALTELENRGDAAAQDLRAALLERGVDYGVAIGEGDAGSDALRSALFYRAARLAPLGPPEVFSDSAFVRPPLVQRFTLGAQRLTVVVVHLKSKRCGDGERPYDAITGCGSDVRLRESQALVELGRRLAEEPLSAGALLLGDFNAYPHEEPIQALLRAGFDALLSDVPAAERYTYVYDGRPGLLDHAFGTLGVRRALRDASIWHVNADESELLSFRLDNPGELYRPDAFRSSDHDPILLGLDLE